MQRQLHRHSAWPIGFSMFFKGKKHQNIHFHSSKQCALRHWVANCILRVFQCKKQWKYSFLAVQRHAIATVSDLCFSYGFSAKNIKKYSFLQLKTQLHCHRVWPIPFSIIFQSQKRQNIHFAAQKQPTLRHCVADCFLWVFCSAKTFALPRSVFLIRSLCFSSEKQ